MMCEVTEAQKVSGFPEFWGTTTQASLWKALETLCLSPPEGSTLTPIPEEAVWKSSRLRGLCVLPRGQPAG